MQVIILFSVTMKRLPLIVLVNDDAIVEMN